MDPDDPAYRGQAEYTPWLLAVYDPFVLGFMARAVWRCPIRPVVDRYRHHVGRRHLDVGPGTGYFLDKAGLPPETEVTLLDPNPNVLAHASRRLAPLNPTSIEADVLKPLPVGGPFDSAALNFVLHCLPGPQYQKAVAIRNVAAVLAPDGVLFGGTVLGSSEQHTPLARAVLWAFNRQGSFDNLGDTEPGLHGVLEESFPDRRDESDRLRRHVHGFGSALTQEPRRCLADSGSQFDERQERVRDSAHGDALGGVGLIGLYDQKADNHGGASQSCLNTSVHENMP